MLLSINTIGNDMVNAPGGRRNQGPRQGKSKIKTILLPIPSNIRDSNTTKYGDSSLNSIGAAVSWRCIGYNGSGKDYVYERMEVRCYLQKVVQTLEILEMQLGGMEGAQGFVTRILASKAAGFARCQYYSRSTFGKNNG